ncbi:hypothetical protein [Rhodoblastus sp.]|uniref:hypothetical protein n=1 Tax=Rhodoblastus sp. TaxID=1962975 RepID=UPI003F9B4B7E
MTNVLLLPQLSGSLVIATNADLRVAVQFVQAGTTTPIDLTGIEFHSQIRLASDVTQIGLDLSTANGLLVNGGVNGTLSWLIPAAQAKTIAPGAYVADLLALGDGDVVNLFQNAPLGVTVNGGVTCFL